jgi:SagB-type dehydrogenase family enzyme
LVQLPPFEHVVKQDSYTKLLSIRRSERTYTDTPITQEQLAFVLWSTQGVHSYRGTNNVATLRPVPSGGARHPFEIIAVIKKVTGLQSGIYHYLPMEHVGEKRVAIEHIGTLKDYNKQITELLAGQAWAAKASVVLFFSCVPYRAEWRYGEAAHRVMLVDLGFIGQNAMLSAAALGLGSCCIAAYDQIACDTTFGLDGKSEYTVLAVPVGVPETIKV